MPERNLNFDEIINRRGTDCLKYDFAVRRGMPEEVRLKNGITPCTLRLSTGIEDIEDLLGELSEVFASLQ